MRLGQSIRSNPLLYTGAFLVAAVSLAALLAPMLAPHDPTRQFAAGLDRMGSPLAPGGKFPLGTDSRGRDVLSRVLFGARISLLIGVAATGIAVALGTLVGVLAGFFGRRADFALMRLTDVVMAFPVLMLAIALAAVLGPSLRNVLLVVGLVSWTGVARVVRGETLSLRERLFVEAARALGSPNFRTLARHILPHLLPTLLVLASLSTATTVLLDAGLSYLGLGVPPPAPSWGGMLTEGHQYYRTAPWLMIWPGVALVWTVAGFNLLGFGARQALDPTRRGQAGEAVTDGEADAVLAGTVGAPQAVETTKPSGGPTRGRAAGG